MRNKNHISKAPLSFTRAIALLTALILLACTSCRKKKEDRISIVSESSKISEISVIPEPSDKESTISSSVTEKSSAVPTQEFDYSGLDAYHIEPFCYVNDNKPFFEYEEFSCSWRLFSEKDSLGREGAADCVIGREDMPDEERGEIGMIKPSGWNYSKYDFIDGKYLFNRCHLLGFQLTGENANELNLITGTRYLNVHGMLPFENMIAYFIRRTGIHVRYRVTPLFVGEELISRGVLMEARSVEDNGEGLELCLFCYNVQPGVEIDYLTGDNHEVPAEYVLDMVNRICHRRGSEDTLDMDDETIQLFSGEEKELDENGFILCDTCFPK